MNGTNTTDYALKIYGDTDCFYSLRVTIDRVLTLAEVEQVSGCLGYGLAPLAGEGLSDPERILFGLDYTAIDYSYDSTKSRRDDPDFQQAFENAARYIQEGTPIRTTNRAGAGTAGTRLVEGIGPCQIVIDVDPDDDTTPPPAVALLTGNAQALAELNAARDALNAAQHAYAQAALRYAGAGL